MNEAETRFEFDGLATLQRGPAASVVLEPGEPAGWSGIQERAIV